MKFIHKVINSFNAFRDDEGATAVEYALIVALIAVVIIAAVTLLGGNLSSIFHRVAVTIGA